MILPAFNLYGKFIGDINGDKQIIMFVYEIRINHIYALTLNNILSKITMEEANVLKFIPYGLNAMGNKNTMRNMITQNNEFLNNMAIVSIFGVKPKEDNVFVILSKAGFISGMEKIRMAEDGKSTLITMEYNKYRAAVEVDALFEKFFTNVLSGRSYLPPTKYKNP